eukprot:CAMPEP_0117037706 /NCGR_PEP_ID=MMETSP0472-20121206/26584_1 /TAXON_ID=693140 ORGANISM="Tiarina fusus, Strain LIS" /NCGR_SAMPLE_ID=MMETSP0472 /ASSEMBLY_ACC=CAM_ASM_000603 /LENGTH=150 /DNA_ID=CAMNT_0004747739 /DNA_START=74 /DNA_END=529 /DNA_ORIENTATION=-
MDDYPAAEPIPDPDLVDGQHHELINFLTNSRDMRKAARSSVKQAAFAGSGAIAGGFLLGPVGGMVGGIAGSIIGFIKADDYDGALLAICKLPEDQKQVLMKRVGQVLIAAGAGATQLGTIDGFRETLADLASRRSVRDDLWNACVQSLTE